MRFIFFAISLALVFGCLTQPAVPSGDEEPDIIVGNDADPHGCRQSAGYSWCEYTQGCYRQWEENCTSPDELSAEAERLYEGLYLTRSHELYSQARKGYLLAGNNKAARQAMFRMFSIEHILLEMNLDEGEAKALVAGNVTNATSAQVDAWLGDPRTIIFNIDGEPAYFQDVAKDVAFQNPNLLREYARRTGINAFYENLEPVVFNETPRSCGNCSFLTMPINYSGTATLNLERSELPETGVLKLWLPLPIETPSQKEVEILSITPGEYLAREPDTNADIGIAYFEVPLDSLDGDLNITIIFRYTAYEVRGAVDPGRVGEYDVESELYQRYTSPSANIALTPQTRELAMQVVGNEINPYLKAQKLYWFVVNGTTYDFMPHITMHELGIPESEYVREHKIGDCGSQSMFFAALCRSVGIPARAIGGYQLITGATGSHFWAEFYIPGYGWLPADVTVAEVSEWWYGVPEDKVMQYKAFYFGNNDAFRFIIQNDVDIPFAPEPEERITFPMVIQSPAAVCESADFDIGLVVAEEFSVEVLPEEEGPDANPAHNPW